MVYRMLWIMLLTVIDPKFIVFLLCTYCEHYCAFILGPKISVLEEMKFINFLINFDKEISITDRPQTVFVL